MVDKYLNSLQPSGRCKLKVYLVSTVIHLSEWLSTRNKQQILVKVWTRGTLARMQTAAATVADDIDVLQGSKHRTALRPSCRAHSVCPEVSKSLHAHGVCPEVSKSPHRRDGCTSTSLLSCSGYQTVETAYTPIHRRVDKEMRYIYKMGCFPATQNNEITTFSRKTDGLESIMLK